MTFEQWFDSNDYIKNHSILSEYGEVYSMLEHAWNAAIASSLAALDATAEAAMLKADPYVDNETVLTSLLTEPPL